MDRVETTQEDDFQWDAQSTCLTSAAVRRLRQNVCTHHVEYWEKHSKDLYRAQPYQKKIAHQGLRFPSHMAWLNQTNEVIPQFWIVNMSSAWVMYVSVLSFFLPGCVFLVVFVSGTLTVHRRQLLALHHSKDALLEQIMALGPNRRKHFDWRQGFCRNG